MQKCLERSVAELWAAIELEIAVLRDRQDWVPKIAEQLAKRHGKAKASEILSIWAKELRARTGH